MSHAAIIFTDRFLKPLYFTLKWSKALFPRKRNVVKEFYVIKFFGLGSLTRIVFVIEKSEVDKESCTFITFEKNKSALDLLGVKGLFIRTKDPFRFIFDCFKVCFHVWSKKHIKVLDMERSSNFSGALRVILSIRKPSVGFYFKPLNQQIGNQHFVSLIDKSAVQGIVEMFGLSVFAVSDKPVERSAVECIVINVNAGKYLPERMFPLQKFALLVCQLYQKYPHSKFLLIGTKNETERVNAFQNMLNAELRANESIINLVGKQNLVELSDTVKNADLIITNDSGPMHLANYFGTKLVAIWGPTSAELVGYPNSSRLLNLTTNLICSPCFLHPKSKIAKACSGEITCFKDRDTDLMIKKIVNFIEPTPAKGNEA